MDEQRQKTIEGRVLALTINLIRAANLINESIPIETEEALLEMANNHIWDAVIDNIMDIKGEASGLEQNENIEKTEGED